MEGPEILSPPFNSYQRRLSVFGAIRAFIASMVGGSLLAYPYLIRSAGIIPGATLLFVSMLFMMLSIYILTLSSRLSGQCEFYDISYRLFGPKLQVFVVFLVIVACVLSIVAFVILSNDIFYSIIQYISPYSIPNWTSSAIKLGTLLLTFPLFFLTSLHSLRHLNVFSNISIFCLICVLAIRSLQNLGNDHQISSLCGSNKDPHPYTVNSMNMEFHPESLAGLLVALPMSTTGFICHSNALRIHAELINPTRARLLTVLFVSFGSVLSLYLLVGISGYAFAVEHTCTNILLNFQPSDYLATFARLFLAFIIFGNIPMQVMPARKALLTLLKTQPTLFRPLLSKINLMMAITSNAVIKQDATAMAVAISLLVEHRKRTNEKSAPYQSITANQHDTDDEAGLNVVSPLMQRAEGDAARDNSRDRLIASESLHASGLFPMSQATILMSNDWLVRRDSRNLLPKVVNASRSSFVTGSPHARDSLYDIRASKKLPPATVSDNLHPRIMRVIPFADECSVAAIALRELTAVSSNPELAPLAEATNHHISFLTSIARKISIVVPSRKRDHPSRLEFARIHNNIDNPSLTSPLLDTSSPSAVANLPVPSLQQHTSATSTLVDFGFDVSTSPSDPLYLSKARRTAIMQPLNSIIESLVLSNDSPVPQIFSSDHAGLASKLSFRHSLGVCKRDAEMRSLDAKGLLAKNVKEPHNPDLCTCHCETTLGCCCDTACHLANLNHASDESLSLTHCVPIVTSYSSPGLKLPEVHESGSSQKFNFSSAASGTKGGVALLSSSFIQKAAPVHELCVSGSACAALNGETQNEESDNEALYVRANGHSALDAFVYVSRLVHLKAIAAFATKLTASPGTPLPLMQGSHPSLMEREAACIIQETLENIDPSFLIKNSCLWFFNVIFLILTGTLSIYVTNIVTIYSFAGAAVAVITTMILPALFYLMVTKEYFVKAQMNLKNTVENYLETFYSPTTVNNEPNFNESAMVRTSSKKSYRPYTPYLSIISESATLGPPCIMTDANLRSGLLKDPLVVEPNLEFSKKMSDFIVMQPIIFSSPNITTPLESLSALINTDINRKDPNYDNNNDNIINNQASKNSINDSILLLNEHKMQNCPKPNKKHNLSPDVILNEKIIDFRTRNSNNKIFIRIRQILSVTLLCIAPIFSFIGLWKAYQSLGTAACPEPGTIGVLNDPLVEFGKKLIELFRNFGNN